jgi:hypothetical protein
MMVQFERGSENAAGFSGFSLEILQRETLNGTQ